MITITNEKSLRQYVKKADAILGKLDSPICDCWFKINRKEVEECILPNLIIDKIGTSFIEYDEETKTLYLW